MPRRSQSTSPSPDRKHPPLVIASPAVATVARAAVLLGFATDESDHDGRRRFRDWLALNPSVRIHRTPGSNAVLVSLADIEGLLGPVSHAGTAPTAELPSAPRLVTTDVTPDEILASLGLRRRAGAR